MIFNDDLEEQMNALTISTQGAGLRIWICKEVVKMHKGAVGVRSDGLGKGSQFFMELPMDPEASFKAPPIMKLRSIAADLLNGFGDVGKCYSRPSFNSSNCPVHTVMKAISGAAQKPMKKPSIAPSNIKILIVDDVASCRKVHRKLVGDYCEIVDEACDGVECVSKVEAALNNHVPYDAILLDNTMPNMSGPEAARRVRELGCRCKIIGVTGNARSEDILDFINHGADKVIMKPLKPETINELIDDLMVSRRTKWVLSKLTRKRSMDLEAVVARALEGEGPPTSSAEGLPNPDDGAVSSPPKSSKSSSVSSSAKKMP